MVAPDPSLVALSLARALFKIKACDVYEDYRPFVLKKASNLLIETRFIIEDESQSLLAEMLTDSKPLINSVVNLHAQQSIMIELLGESFAASEFKPVLIRNADLVWAERTQGWRPESFVQKWAKIAGGNDVPSSADFRQTVDKRNVDCAAAA